MAAPPFELEDTVVATLEALGALQGTIKLALKETVVPPNFGDTGGARALARLKGTRGPNAGLTLKDTIGEGGMGVVRSGTQESLGRTVAIKTLRKEAQSPEGVLTLLREAWVTGVLEHPNILPVYDLRVDDNDMPLMVSKRIEGADWGEIFFDPDEMASRLGKGDLLERNIEVLMQVCRAVSYAHKHGMIHRDIKPDNIRIGSFGEVYLLDWGIAVALEDDGTGRFPLAKDATEMAGTPMFLAPEMLGNPEFGAISPLTDVYLLGATLYQVVTGYAPHDRDTFADVVRSVLNTEFALAGIPNELAGIIERAMAFAPDDRFHSAEELRNALDQFLAHRGADKLVADAMKRLAELETLINDDGEDARVGVHDRLGACTTGFSAAMDLHAENEHAWRGLNRAIEAVVNYELGRGDARAASKLLERLSNPTQTLVDAVKTGLVEQHAEEARQRELEALGKDFDTGTGARSRAIIGVLLGLLSIVMPIVGALQLQRESYTAHLATILFFLFLTIAFMWRARKSLKATAYNRRLSAAVIMSQVATLLATTGCALLGITASTITVLYLFVFWMTATMVSSTAEWRLWPAGVGYGAAFLLAAAFPEYRFYCMSAGHLVMAITIGVIWGRASSQSPT